MLKKSIYKYAELGSLFILLLIALILLPGTPISLADTPPTSSQPVLVLPTQSPITVTHIIQAGDIPWDLAETYDISVDEILEANEIDDPSNLQIGQEIIIPTSDDLDAPESNVDNTLAVEDKTADITTDISATTEAEEKETVVEDKSAAHLATETTAYAIEQGDTLLDLAIDNDVAVTEIVALNPDLDPTNLQIGQELIIPTANNQVINVAAENAPAIEKSATDIATAKEASATPARETTTYTIERGDTLLALAVGYDLDVDDIMTLNPGIDSTNLQIGQIIDLPGKLPARPPNPVRTASTTFSSPPPSPSTFNTSPSTPVQAVADQPDVTGIAQLEAEMIAAVNAERVAQGLPAYQVGPTLTIVARKHAADMVNRGYFAHNTPEGITLRNRLATEGLVVNWAGENIQKNTRAFDKTAMHAFNWFMGSRPHRNNILHSRHTHIGVGVVEGPPGWYSYVLVFAKP